MMILIGVAILVVILALMSIGMFNRLVQLRNRFKNSYAQIDVQLKRRYDLIPNLIETAKGYISHERQTLEAVVFARTRAVSANQQASSDPGSAEAIKGVSLAEGSLTGALGRLFAVVENYPDLKANQNMMQVSEALTSTENKIAFARQAYNDSVMDYNTACESFPSSFFAGTFNFQPAQLFQIDNPEEKKAVKVSFS